MVVKIEILLSHEDFVRALSRRLVIDEHVVDDVVQETFLAALEKPPRAAGALRTWLGTVARNFIFSMRRDDSRRVLRERASGRTDGAPSPAEIVEREAARRCLVESVLDLDEIYRDPILLRYYEDCPPREIARRLGLPVETVRTRLKRGLAQLRKDLDALYGGDGRSWCIALLLVSGLEKKFLAPGIWAATAEKIPGLLAMNANRAAALIAAGLLTATAVFVILFADGTEALPSLPAATHQVSVPPTIVTIDDKNVALDARETEPAGKEIPSSPPSGLSPTVSVARNRTPVKSYQRRDSMSSRRRFEVAQKGQDIKVPYNMVRIPAGEAWLGMHKKQVKELGEGQSTTLSFLSGSIPRHKEEVEDFFCDRYEVTNAQWAHFLESTDREPSQFLVEMSWRGKKTFPEKEANFPVRNVDLDDARAFSRWCGKRLPTETEWMRAASGKKGTLYAWGNQYDSRKYTTRDRLTRREKLMPVGTYPGGVSPFGVHDMTGSVWEWTESPFEPYEGFDAISYWVGRRKVTLSPGFDGRQYVVKGGVYNGNDLVNLLPVRQPCLGNTNLDSLGFRCVKDVEPGATVFKYVQGDLLGSEHAGLDLVGERSFVIEAVEEGAAGSFLIPGFEYFMIAPVRSIPATEREIKTQSIETPQVFGVLSTSVQLDEPELSPGTYLLAYRHSGESKKSKNKTAQLDLRSEFGVDYPEKRNLVLFIKPKGLVAGYVNGSIRSKRPRDNYVEARVRSRTYVQVYTDIEQPYSARFEFHVRLEDNPFQ